MFKLAKDSAVKAPTQAINQLKAVLVIAGPALRERLSGLGNREWFRTCARLSPLDGEDGEGDEDAVAQATRINLSLPAQRIEQLTGQIDELNQRLTRLVERHAPQLLVPARNERRTQEGKTRREIIRRLERCAAREVFNLVRTVSTKPPL